MRFDLQDPGSQPENDKEKGVGIIFENFSFSPSYSTVFLCPAHYRCPWGEEKNVFLPPRPHSLAAGVPPGDTGTLPGPSGHSAGVAFPMQLFKGSQLSYFVSICF